MIIEAKKSGKSKNESLTKDAIERIKKKDCIYGLKGKMILYGIASDGKKPLIVSETLTQREGAPIANSTSSVC